MVEQKPSNTRNLLSIDATYLILKQKFSVYFHDAEHEEQQPWFAYNWDCKEAWGNVAKDVK